MAMDLVFVLPPPIQQVHAFGAFPRTCHGPLPRAPVNATSPPHYLGDPVCVGGGALACAAKPPTRSRLHLPVCGTKRPDLPGLGPTRRPLRGVVGGEAKPRALLPRTSHVASSPRPIFHPADLVDDAELGLYLPPVAQPERGLGPRLAAEMLSKSFKAGKCKTSLKLAVARIKLLKNKREVQVKQMRRDLAQLLETGQDQTARIRVEHVIREEKTMSAYELIELYCELIVARLAIIESQKSCPIDLKEAICSVIEKLSAKAPDIETKIKVLTAIAEGHNIKWEPKAFEEEVQKSSEDLLKGPSSFTNKIPMESSTVQFPPPSVEKHKSVTKHAEIDVDRSSFGSNSFSSPTLVDTASQPGRKAAARTYDKGETGHTYFREEVASSNRQKWTMEFKDATSAAQAAAESAERASMAARAAAELASRGNDPEYSNRSHGSSNYRSKHEGGNLTGSKFQGVSPTRDSVRSDHNIDEATYATQQRMQSSMESQRVQEHVAGDSKNVNEDSKTTRSHYGRNVSSASTRSSSEKEANAANWRHKEIVEDESSGEEFTERHPIRPVSSSSTLDELKSKFGVKDGSSSSLHSVSRLQPAEVSGMASRDDRSPQSNAVAYDVSDGASSGTEDEIIGFGDRGDTVSHSLHDKKNAGKYEHPQSLSRSSQKDMVTMDKLHQFSSSFTDANTESHSSDPRGHELNYGRLSGGLRNKGSIRPFYLKSAVIDESLPSETSTDDSSKKPSPKAETATFEDAGKSAHNRKPHFRSIEGSRSRSRSQNSSDSDGVEDLEQHPAPGSRPYHTATSPLSTTKLDGNLTIDNKEKASSTFFRPESNEISREKPRQRTSWRTSKESGRASIAAYVDEGIEKQSLSPVGYDTSPILSSQKLEGTKTSVPSTTRVSGVADIYGKKTSVRTSKGQISTAASFFDEENDEEVVSKPQDPVGNLGIRSGRRLSQRTKASKADQLSNSSVSSHDLETPDLESKSLESTSYISKTSSKPSIASVKPEKSRTSKFLPPDVSVEQHPARLSDTEVLVQKDRLSVHSVPETPFKPSASSVEPNKSRTSKFLPPNISTKQHSAKHSEDEVLAQKDGPEPSQRGLSYNNQSQSVPGQAGVPASNEIAKPSTSRENSLNDSHVHPKLPDYERLADYFKSLRSNRR
ncbi:hypothetical protein Taro_022477 [Colocasia esculenta]|uniref:Uncharacterized protein n=1 Tax=Colocasia esculenta TaxID=4460 RepID=A0A843VBG7_COLES|nr:hypothetical protein [Colocasia esculenta]